MFLFEFNYYLKKTHSRGSARASWHNYFLSACEMLKNVVLVLNFMLSLTFSHCFYNYGTFASPCIRMSDHFISPSFGQKDDSM